MHEEFTSTIRGFLGVTNEYFSCFGFIVYSVVVCRVMTSLLLAVTQPLFSKHAGWLRRLKSIGNWAVVTGSTDGIGKAYAEELASKGLNIVLISRSPEKLAAVAKEIETTYKVETKTITMDFSDRRLNYGEIKSVLKDMKISTLVNNVGVSYQYPEYLLDIPDREKALLDLIWINVISMTMMTSIVLPNMVEKGGGVIINVGSASGDMICPFLTAYSACKAYVKYFSEGLNSEYSDKGVITQCVMPFYVTTKLSKFRKSSLMVPNPKTYVKSALNSLGMSSSTYGYFAHNLFGWLLKKLPTSLVTWQVKNQHLGIRARRYAKNRAKAE
ncbi:very-long-chain 3-oxoacyl-CoA reductase-B [Octopus bimaculoides]|uniref:Very-long-chain 3-oxoacyl-CoA reductase n=1 Tax=Octopus bimaculoides TaxID=37653 RepID=A0A0L8I8R1_OCTBM|nr:very-long-chain 3-oxoacyl-CoA reductase-B [Octopus bimaculoides]|eukprot:XP_014785806.1 PREDICTED: very-long-chain 3-oxoacyl-CoA reductase-B-like [Octopus bimaculoides]